MDAFGLKLFAFGLTAYARCTTYAEFNAANKRVLSILGRGWLIERARVRRLLSELDALESELDELRQELEHQRAEAWEAMSDAQRDAAIKGACA